MKPVWQRSPCQSLKCLDRQKYDGGNRGRGSPYLSPFFTGRGRIASAIRVRGRALRPPHMPANFDIDMTTDVFIAAGALPRPPPEILAMREFRPLPATGRGEVKQVTPSCAKRTP